MITLFRKNLNLLLVLLFPVLLIFMWLFPLDGLILGILFLLFSLVIITYSIVEKHKKAYLKGKITKVVYIRNTILEIFIILLTMLLAALLGDYVARVVTQQITNETIKFIAGVLIGLLIGICVGIIIKRTWEKIQLIFPKWNQSKT